MSDGVAQFGQPLEGVSQEEITVFHVDDDQPYLDLTADCLERVNDDFTVVSESDPQAALNRIESVEPDCIVSDYDMPAMNGLELYAELQDRGNDYQFILFTGQGSESIAAEAMSADVTDYIQKGGTDTYDVLANRIVDAVEAQQNKRLAQQAIDHYRELVETSHLPVYQYDDRGEIRYANEPATTLYGVSAIEDLVGRRMQEFLSPAESEAVERRLTALADGEPVPPAEFQVQTTDDRERTVEAMCAPTPHTRDTVGQTIARDVTPRREREREFRRLRSVVSTALEDVPVGIWSYDVDRESVSRYGIASLLGIDDEALGTGFASFFDHIHPDDRESIADEYRRAVERHEPQTLTFRVEAADGSVRRVTDHIDIVADDDGEVTHVAGVIHGANLAMSMA